MDRIYNEGNRDGITLVEVIVVMVIVTVLTSIAIPSLIGFLQTVKEKTYVMEANSLHGSIQAYLVTEYVQRTLDGRDVFRDLTTSELNSEENPLHPFLRIEPVEGAVIAGITIDEKALMIMELVYQVEGYKIVIIEGTGITVEKLDEERQDRKQ